MAVATMKLGNLGTNGTQGISLEWLSPTKLSVEPKYQRDIYPNTVKKIVDNFDFMALGVLCVAKRGRSYAIIDGQHRWEAAKALGISEVPCAVYDGLTIAEQAALWVHYNRDRKAPHIVHVFQAAIAQGDENYLEVDRIVRSVGHSIGLGRLKFQAVGAALQIHRNLGPKVLHATLAVMARAWKNAPQDARDSMVLKATASVFSYYGGGIFDWDNMERALAATTRDDLVREATARQTSRKPSGRGQGTTTSNMLGILAQVLVEHYNAAWKGTRSRWLPMPASRSVFVIALKGYRHNDD